MKRILSIAFGFALLVCMANQMDAQVYTEYEAPKLSKGLVRQFFDITSEGTHSEIPGESFKKYPGQSVDYNDGYYKIPIGFPFEFNGTTYYDVWVCVNGFVQFLPPGETPLFVPANYPKALFVSSSSYPKNVVAPFWGDHYYRSAIDNIGKTLGTDNLFTESNISYLNYVDEGKNVLKIQWKDLNINYLDPVTSLPVTSSVATFQVVLYEQVGGKTFQGNVEFAYGPAGADLEISTEQKVIAAGASVGIKGAAQDYMNGLSFKTGLDPKKDTTLTGAWQPSNGTDTTIVFASVEQYNEEEWWGDGDVDLSKFKGNRHYNKPQNRFVTVNDAWLIMRSIATRHPLDSARRRAAYHGDVNHNGRFFYDPDTLVANPKSGELYPLKKNITWRDMNYRANLDNPEYSVSDINQLYFQVNEHDATMILRYLSARLPELPWVHDTVPLYGRVIDNEDLATTIEFGNAQQLNADQYRIPVYLNGYSNSPMSFRFDTDCEVVKVETVINGDQKLHATNGVDRVVVIGDGEFSPEAPVCYVTVIAEKDINITAARFNDREVGGFGVKLSSVENTNDIFSITTVPNPFVNNVTATVNITNSGLYTLNIYDELGHKVKSFGTVELSTGKHPFDWNGTDAKGTKVQSGVYVFNLTGEDVSVSTKVVLSK